MSTKPDIINMTLAMIGQPPMSGPSDTSTWVKRIVAQYPASVRLLLERHPWNYCSVWEQCARDAATPVSNWTFGYIKPVKCLRLNLVNTSGDDRDNEFDCYDDAGGLIYADADTIYTKFISTDWLTKEGSWPEVFARAVAGDIASIIAPIATKQDRKLENAEGRAVRLLKSAKSWDASQKPFRRLPEGDWVRARRTGSRWNTDGWG